MSNRILSYRGLLADGGQDTILLSTKKGEKGYRITKFEMMGGATGTYDHGFVMKIYKDEQSSVDALIDFSDNRLLGAGYTANHENIIYPLMQQIIFDQEIFNQDIYITCKDIEVGQSCNYYLELEVIKLDESQAMVATLKDIRNNS